MASVKSIADFPVDPCGAGNWGISGIYGFGNAIVSVKSLADLHHVPVNLDCEVEVHCLPLIS